MKEVILEINDFDNPFEREKLEGLPKDILVELLIRYLKRNIKAIEYIKGQQSFETYQHLKTIYDDIDSTEEVWEDYDFKDILNILKGSEE